VNITSLYTGTQYPVLHWERIGMKYGEAVHLTIREDAEDNVIGLSCRFSMAPRLLMQTWLV
jgi:hypothetical protein